MSPAIYQTTSSDSDERMAAVPIGKVLPSLVTSQALMHEIAAMPRLTGTGSLGTQIQAAWAILMAHYTYASEVFFEAMLSRDESMAPVRVRIDYDGLVAELQEQLRLQAVANRQSTEVRRVRLQQIQRAGHDLDPRLDMMVLAQPAAKETRKGSGEQAAPASHDGLNGYAMTLVCQLKSDGALRMSFSFDRAMIDMEQAARMLRQLEHILKQLSGLDSATTKVCAVEAISSQDRRDIWSWNSSVPATIERCVHHLIEEAARRAPQATAVCAWDGEFSYSELDALATRLAHHLVTLGVGPEVIVPLCFEKSKWVPVAVLAVMKAGGASVTLDDTLPDERLRSIITRTQGPVMLTSVANEDRAGRLGHNGGVAMVVPKHLLQQPAIEPTTTLPHVDPSNTLYVVFTSGSTGTPKGAIITHANFSSAIHHQRVEHYITSEARVYDFASYAFDVSWLNLLHFLAAGACLCIPSQADRQNDIAGSMRRLRVNWAQITPSVGRMIDPAEVPALKCLVFSGEAMLAQDVEHWNSMPTLINTYGPAECTVTTTVGEVDRRITGDPTIGWGSAACVWVVDPRTGASLAARGAIGELWLEGPLVGQGYLADPDKTAATFIEDPPWLLDGKGSGRAGRRGRLYKTGDLVRYNSNGSLAYLGRKDAQVKIRGQRVELGDIEYHVQQNLAGGMDCRVIAEVLKPAESSNQILVAFLSVDLGTESANGINHANGSKPASGTKLTNGTGRTNGVDRTNGINHANGSKQANGTKLTNGAGHTNGIDHANGTKHANGINHTNGASYTNGVDHTNGINHANGTKHTNGVNHTNGAGYTNGTDHGNGINDANGITHANRASRTNGINHTNGTKHANGISHANGASRANGNKARAADNIDDVIKELTSGLNERLAEHIPVYMIPNIYLALSEIPMTPTGKTDRRQLREMVSAMTLQQLKERNVCRTTRREPTTAIELQLRKLWATVLDLDASSISADDSFLQIGGDSIAAMKLVGAAREYGLELTVATLFQHPRLCQLAPFVTPAKSAQEQTFAPFSLLSSHQRREEVQAQVAAYLGVQASQIEDVFPCTPLQEGLIALSARRPGNYIGRMLLGLHDDVDLSRLRAACEEVVATTPILRTRVVALPKQGMVQAVVAQKMQWVESSDAEAAVARAREHELTMSFNTPLVRFDLIDDRQRDRRYLLWTMHHAVYDGWSVPLMLHQVELAYEQAPRPALAPFQLFLRHIMALDQAAVDTYWRSQFEGCEAAPFPALPTESYQPHADKVLFHQISGLAWLKTDITSSTAVRTALSILLAQYTATSDVVFGATVAGRQAAVASVERMAGPTIATVPVRVQVNRSASVADLLQQVQAQATAMSEFEQTGISRIRSNWDRVSQFQTLVVIQPARPTKQNSSLLFKDTDRDVADAASLDLMDGFDENDDGDNYALEIVCQLQADGVRLRFSYDQAVVPCQQATRMAQQLEHILRQICVPENGRKKVAAMDWIGPEDLHDIWNWNADVAPAVERCMHHIISERARVQPKALAVCAWDGEFTYAELDVRSTQLAHHLVTLGVGPEVLVPLCFEKSRWMPVAILGVMKAGGACVGMDVTLPEERLRTLVAQANASVIVSSIANRDLARRLADGSPIAIPETFTASEGASLTATELPVVSPWNKLYVVFTSGSTGTPKGAIMTHSNFSTAVHHQHKYLNPSARVYDFASYAFDISWYNVLHTLAAGACMCIPSQEDRQNNLAGSIHQLKATVMYLTPSVARLIDPASVPHLRHIVFGGELLLPDDVMQWRAGPQVINTYGPAECSITATFRTIDPKAPPGPPSLGTGYGLNLWIVDIETGTSLIPVGGVGELWLEGPLVGSGYLGDPEKTAATYIEDPPWLLQGGPGCPGRQGRLYKTGDLMRYNADGSLAFVARKDAQVKINGQRVELGDIESHVRRDLVERADCQVVVEVIKPKESSSAVLAAFISIFGTENETDKVHNAALAALLQGIEDRLAERLPRYMVPTTYVPVRQIPVTGNGKTDRRRLRELGASTTLAQLDELTNKSQTTVRQPSTEIEIQLCKLWAAILSIETGSIGADDNFLKLGGNSITAMRLVSAAREQGMAFTVADLFKHPRLCELAQRTTRLVNASKKERTVAPFSLLWGAVDPRTVREQAAELCGVAPASIEDVFPCTPLQEGLLALTAQRPGDYILRSVFELREETDLYRFCAAWETVVATTPILRTRIVDLPGQGLVQVVAIEPVRWHREDTPKRHGTEPMSLGTPLVHFGLTGSDADGKSHFVWTIHHALYDGWLYKMVLEQVERQYRQEATTIPFASFQPFVKHLMALDPEAVAAYWRAQLHGSEAVAFPSLPSKDYRPQADRTLTHHISQLTWPRSGITAATVVRAAWAILTARYTDASDVIFGATVTGRQADVAGIERMAGPTIATVPVRVSIGNDDTVDQFLQQVQTQTAEMTEFEQTGLQRIRRIGDGDLEQASHFQTLLLIRPTDGDAADQSAIFKEMPALDDADSLGEFQTYALMLTCQLEANGMVIYLSFDSSILENDQASRIAQQLERVMRQICAPDHTATNIAAIETASTKDLTDIWRWNAAVPPPVERCVHDLISEVVAKKPYTQAVCAWDGDLTYAELDQYSTQIAHHLVALGVGLDTIVPLYFEKSKWYPISVLGVIKAGGAVVAMDVTLPDERLRTIIEQVKGPIIVSSVTHEGRARTLGQLSNNASVVVPEALLQKLVIAAAATAALPTVTPSNKLYVVFTSGSTGTPKGAVISHANFSSASRYQQAELGFSATSRVYDFASYAFDISWSNNLRTLAAGGCICIPSQEDRQNALASSIGRLRANTIDLTASVSRLISPSDVPGLQHLIFCGEPVLARDAAQWRTLPKVLNVYGPAECTVHALVHPVDASQSGNPGIGRGSGVVPWVVDRSGTSLVAVGGIGQLLLEGPSVGQGYFGDPAKTAAAFIEDPKWLIRGGPGHPGRCGRLYITGDLVRYNSDGTLDFVGRKDAQVKIGGQRVELGDIEHHLRQSLNDADCQVLVDVIRPDGSDHSVLVAFITINKDIEAEGENALKDRRLAVQALTAGLNERLAAHLPAYMIPTVYIPVHNIPMTATGKADRRQLREIGAAMTPQDLSALATPQTATRAPSTATELQLQELWATILGITADSISSAEHSFLQLGGDSIAAMRLVRAAQEQGLSFTVADLFLHPRLCDLAAVAKSSQYLSHQAIAPFTLLGGDVDQQQVRTQAAELCGLAAPSQIEDVFPCTPLQEGMLALTTKREGDYVNELIFKLPPEISVDRFREAWDDVVATTSILRTRLVDLPGGPGLMQVVVAPAPVQWQPYNANERNESEPMGLGTPLLRFRLNEKTREFAWTIHHALYDAWSLPLMLDQVEKAYQCEASTALAPFQSFVEHVLALDQDSVAAYWRTQLEGCEAALFPALPSPDYQPRVDQTIHHHITELQWPRTDITAATVVRAAWAILTARYIDTNDVVFGAIMSGRQAADVAGIDRMAGPTVATVPVRVQLGTDDTTGEFLQHIQTQATSMTAFEQTGLQRIRRVATDLEQASQFQSLIMIQRAEQDDKASSTLFQEEQELRDELEIVRSFGIYALMLDCRLEESGAQFTFAFDSSLLASKETTRFAQQLESIIRQLCAPEQAAAKLSTIQAASEHDLREIWSSNSIVPASVQRCVHHLIADIVQRQPQAPAVCAWDGDLTYAELDEQSTRLAHHLVALGVGPEVIVPLYFEKSKWTPVAMLGVMKAGGASVAMDATLPDERLRTIVAQVEGPVILASSSNQARAGAISTRSNVVVPETLISSTTAMSPFLSTTAIDADLSAVRPSNTFCVIFTSGSTGAPKGAVFTHANFSSALHYQLGDVGVTTSSRVFDFASYAFDAAWSNVTMALTKGACLCIPSQEDRQNRIMASIARLRANWVAWTPSVGRPLDPAEAPCLKHVVFGGEPLLARDIAQWQAVPNLTNVYGPAECGVAAAMRKCEQDCGDPNVGFSKGMNAWLVQRDQTSLAPLGSIGELWVEGPSVSQGYHADSAKTADCFVVDPPWLLRGGPGYPGRRGRAYRTGDLLRYEADGSLTFVGRKDAQVKIRGQRIELGDVAHHVHRQLAPGVDCRVVAEVITPAERPSAILAAFISPNIGSGGAEKEEIAGDEREVAPTDINHVVQGLTVGLDERLEKHLAVYMIPTVYIPLSQIPMTATGKTDRRRLREIGASMTLKQLSVLTATRTASRDPDTPMERQLQTLWAAALKVEARSIGAEDSFIKLGGDSIAAMRLVSAARLQGISFTVADLFSNPRLRQLALVADHNINTEELIAPYALLHGDVDKHRVCEQAATFCSIDAACIEDIFPCTPLQEGLLALSAKRPGDYVNRTVLNLHTHVDIDHFRTAWETAVATIPILRTRIIDLPGQGLVQVVTTEPLQWRRSDALEPGEKESMGLGTPLMRFSLDQRRCVWTIHHALYDGWSLPLVLEQVEQTYQRAAPPAALAPFQPLVKHILALDNERIRKYWCSQLESCEAASFPALPSKAYQPRSDQTLEYRIAGIRWPSVDGTAASVIRAAWAILVARYTDTHDVVFGATVTGRQAAVPGVEHMAGPTIATVPVRIRVNREQSVAHFLEQTQLQATRMIEYEQTGLQHIRRLSQDVEAASQFQTLLVIQAAATDSAPSGLYEVASESDDPTNATSAFNAYALAVMCQLESDGMQLTISFDSAVLDHDRAARMAQQLDHILWQLCSPENEHRPLTAVDWISPQDLHDIWKRNSTVPSSVDRCVHDLITEYVQRQPEAAAVCAWDGELTYAELDAQATRLARHLVALGVGPDVLVLLCFEKSKWMPVAMLSVMKAGGASVAIDITLPDERLRAITTQVQASVIVASTTQAARARTLGDKITVVEPETLLQEPHTEPNVDLPVVHPTNKLYVVFTSGSTGVPKGVVITHANFCSAVQLQGEALGFSHTARIYDFVSYAFDIAWSNNLRSLAVGACICIPSEGDRQNAIARSISELRANWVVLTPSVARSLNPADILELEHLVFGGEALLAEDVQQWKTVPRLLNGYGPAECTVMSTVCVVNKDGTGDPSIGESVGLNAWVVDKDDGATLASFGSIGELWLEGPLVGQGYLAEEAKTAAAFVQDPPWLLRGVTGRGRRGRLYKTGDLVRYNPDGSLAYLGRKDAQVKIRGQRVELGDIEHHIRHHLASDCQVVAEVIRPAQSSNPVLAAFVSVRVDPDAAAEEYGAAVTVHLKGLDAALAERLPAYMIPTVYIPLRRIPMATTGKTDRRQLREIGASTTLKELGALTAAPTVIREPSTAMEAELCELWAAVLGTDTASISADDSFFRIGGDSIAAMRLVGAAGERGLELTVAMLFKHPRLCDLAANITRTTGTLETSIEPFSLLGAIDAATLRAPAALLCGVETAQIEDVFPCTPLQEGLLALTAKHSGDYINRTVFQLHQHVDLDRFRAAWDEVAATTPILRTRIIDLPGQGLVQVVVRGALPWQHDSSAIDSDTVEPNMGLGTPLVRFRLADGRKDGKPCFEWTIHHALYDGWSLMLLLDQVEKDYSQETRPTLAPFQRFVKHLLEVDGERAESYWRSQLEDCGAALYPAPPSNDYKSRADSTIAHHTKLQWPTTDITAATAVRAAWSILAARQIDANDVIFGATVTGRQAAVAGIQQMAGPTIATVPVRVSIDQEATVDQLLRQVQAQAVGMAEFEQMGLQRIRHLGPGMHHASQFQTLIVIQPADQGGREPSVLFKDDHGSGDGPDSGTFNAYALMLTCQLEKEGIDVTLDFDSTVLSPEQAQRLAQQLGHILQQLCAPELGSQLVAAVEATSLQDLEEIWTWNASVPPLMEQCVHHLFADVVRRQPKAPAVCAWDGELTYAELDAQSTKLAHHLVALGVGRKIIVPLLFEKSKWTPVAMLGVMKAGGASVAMDVTLPDERLRTMVTQVNGPVIISSLTNQDRAGALSKAASVVVPEMVLYDTAPTVGAATALPAVHPSDTLYVVFTSGSTGTPKGAVISHANFSSAVHYQDEILGFGPGARVYDFASYAFDISWSNNLRSLASGACVCVPSQEERQNDIAGSIHRLRANLADLTPSVTRLIEPADVPSLQQIIFSGEALSSSDTTRWRAVPRLVNGYGPAECTVFSVIGALRSAQMADPSIGHGAGLRTWVVDAGGAVLAPIGGIGELWLEGPLVGQGYLGDAAKTAASFVVDPPWLLRGAGPGHSGRRGRLYRTGDLVRYLADGSLSFIGRKDAQIKINGQRIELGDVAHHVRTHLGDRPVVAEVLTPIGRATAVLAAFIQIAPPLDAIRELTAGLAEKLAEQLPASMVPAAYIPIEQIPMTATGKIDRRRLRELGAALSQDELMAMAAPRWERREPATAIERQLRELWAFVLDVPSASISADDDFLEVGGDSITAMRLVGVAREHGLSLTVVDVLQHGRLSELAAVLENTDQVYSDPEPFSLVDTGADCEAFLRSEIRPHLEDAAAEIDDVLSVNDCQLSSLSGESTAAGRRCYHFFVDLPRGTSVQRLIASCALLCNQVDMLRMVFIQTPGEYLQVVLRHLQPAIDVKAVDGDMAAACQKLYDADLQTLLPFGSSFVRFFITLTPDGSVRLTLRISHAQYDGMSLGPLLERLTACYRGLAVPALPRFAGFIRHTQLRQASGRQYWRSLLDGASLTRFTHIASAPTTELASAEGSASAATQCEPLQVQFTVPAPRTREGITPATVFNAACAGAIAKATGSRDVVFGLTVSGRSMLPPALQSVIGPCVNYMPMRARYEAEVEMGSAVTAMREQITQSMRFETSPFENIRKHCTTWPASDQDFGFLVSFFQFDVAPDADVIGKLEVYNRRETLNTPVVLMTAKPAGESWLLDFRASPQFHRLSALQQLGEEVVGLLASFA